MAKKGSGAKQKGKQFELKIARILRRSGLDENARRSFQSGAQWQWKSDVYTKLNFAFECKKHEGYKKFWNLWEQAESQRKSYKPPVLLFSSNFRPILAVMDFNDWINLVLENKQLKEKYEDGLKR